MFDSIVVSVGGDKWHYSKRIHSKTQIHSENKDVSYEWLIESFNRFIEEQNTYMSELQKYLLN